MNHKLHKVNVHLKNEPEKIIHPRLEPEARHEHEEKLHPRLKPEERHEHEEKPHEKLPKPKCDHPDMLLLQEEIEMLINIGGSRHEVLEMLNRINHILLETTPIKSEIKVKKLK